MSGGIIHEKTTVNYLRLFRRKNGLSQKEVACLMGCKNAASISHYERGRKLPSLHNALKLEIIYHAPVAFLFGDLYKDLRREIEGKKERAHEVYK